MPITALYKPLSPDAVRALIKTLRIVKLVAILLIIGCLHVSAKGYAQTVTLSMKNTPLSQVFKEIRKQTGFNFIYNSDVNADGIKVNVDVKQVSVKEALERAFLGLQLGFAIEETTVIVKTKNGYAVVDRVAVDGPNPIDVTGKVVNEKGEPVEGVTVSVKGGKQVTTTNASGEFSLATVDANAVLVFSSVNMETFELKVSGKTELVVNLKTKVTSLGNVEVVLSTGYQDIPKERATGSFAKIDNQLLNRKVSVDILSRLDGVTGGLFLYPGGGGINSDPLVGGTKLGINIRGQSTLLSSIVNADPLIVVDNFPYEGDIRNINPNDIESVTILKDAAAASIWGARSGNGVIIITSKKGKKDQRTKLDFNSNFTISDKPYIYKDPSFLDSKNYMEIEKYLFDQGFFDFNIDYPELGPVSPAVEIFAKQRSGTISQADAVSQLNALQATDVRKDLEKYIYRKSLNQQYALSLSGGSHNLAYKLSVGFDKGLDALINNDNNRLTINSLNTYTPIKNLDIIANIRYAESKSNNNTPYPFSIGGIYGNIYPYAKLADENGNHLTLSKNLGRRYTDSLQNLGYLDWNYNPLNEIDYSNNSTKLKDLVLQFGARYKIIRTISAELQFQNQRQRTLLTNYRSIDTYFARNLINTFAYISSGSLKYPIPKGGILDLRENEQMTNNLRGQVNYNENLGSKHSVTAIIGGEIRESKGFDFSRRSYGYDDRFGTSVDAIDYVTLYSVLPFGSSRIPTISGNYQTSTYRYISYYFNSAYNYNNKYTFSLSGRKDGSNIFGVKTNDKIVPLWSAGFKWDINKENFYHFNLIPQLNFRSSYGYNGNIYNGSAYLIATYGTSSNTSAQTAIIRTPPNPELRWERVKILNLGLDFSFQKDIISGSIEWFKKDGIDLIEEAPLAPSTGYSSFFGNAAATRTLGFDITLNSRIFDKEFKWINTLIINSLKSKVTHFDSKFQAANLVSNYGGVAFEGKPLYSIYSYKWAGLDANTGDPLGYINKAPSNNYASIIGNITSIDSLVYGGSAIPTLFGSFRNSFSYKNISLSFNIIYKLNYVFRRPTINLNYQDILINGGHMDYVNRWKQPGDEKYTNIPSLIYPSNSDRNLFYQNSEITVEKGDHIRLQDISLSYELNKKMLRKLPLESLQVYVYMNNVGIIWKANNKGIDPDYPRGFPASKTISFGIRGNF